MLQTVREYARDKLPGSEEIATTRAPRGRLRAKTQYSFSTDPQLRGAPEGHVFSVRDVCLNAGAGFMVVLSGEIMTMPGLPKKPASDNIDIDADGQIVGLASTD